MKYIRSIVAGIAATVIAIALMFAGGSSAGADTAAAQDVAESSATTAVPGEAPGIQAIDVQINAYSGGVLRGQGYFYSYGEHLYACDRSADGRTVTSQLYWDGAVRASVADGNGASAGCGHRNLEIAEGKYVLLRVCLSGVGCTAWVRGQA
ncbi:hypothetical protein EV193_10669 [Herbihabitans rhizosphaerae]|uniref:Uncharacterized protein n=1 Tax=Herbihabitans rhizosphaerae TaxID=1872711 RepID=A0A4Q7KK52_9PSEU|nr:hypothetical protein [Herbihabitans rhizosphaerae]RZS36835.1 hypothetical protein EV193_10669 [Herbihabitans rhizosphaerae]